MDNKEMAASLRLIADLLESNPDFPQPDVSGSFLSWDDEKRKRQIRALVPFEKKYSDEYFWMKRKVGTVQLDYVVNRKSVCRPVVVGKRRIEEKIIPAVPEKPSQIIPAHEEDIIQWKCDPVIEESEQAADLMKDAEPVEVVEENELDKADAEESVFAVGNFWVVEGRWSRSGNVCHRTRVTKEEAEQLQEIGAIEFTDGTTLNLNVYEIGIGAFVENRNYEKLIGQALRSGARTYTRVADLADSRTVKPPVETDAYVTVETPAAPADTSTLTNSEPALTIEDANGDASKLGTVEDFLADPKMKEI
jgi:hypothetical protein